MPPYRGPVWQYSRPPTVHAVHVDSPPSLADNGEARPDPLWDTALPATIAHFHERSGSHRPATEVRLLWDCDALYVRFDVADRREEIVARYTAPNSPSYKDSCVEIFLSNERSGDTCIAPIYINFELKRQLM